MRLRRFGAATRNETDPQSRITAFILLRLDGRPGRLCHRENVLGMGRTQEEATPSYSTL
jgi:hypothetical protein